MLTATELEIKVENIILLENHRCSMCALLVMGHTEPVFHFCPNA